MNASQMSLQWVWNAEWKFVACLEHCAIWHTQVITHICMHVCHTYECITTQRVRHTVPFHQCDWVMSRKWLVNIQKWRLRQQLVARHSFSYCIYYYCLLLSLSALHGISLASVHFSDMIKCVCACKCIYECVCMWICPSSDFYWTRYMSTYTYSNFSVNT